MGHRVHGLGLGGEGDVGEPSGLRQRAGVLDEHRSRHAPDQRLDVGPDCRGQGPDQREIRGCHPSSGLQHARDLAPDARLFWREVEHAVGDHDVHARVRDRGRLDLS